MVASASREPVHRERLRISARSAVLAVAMFGATLALLAVVAAAQRVIGWILVAGTMAALLHPLVSLVARRVPRAVATGLVMLSLVGALGAVGYGLIDDIARETRHLQEIGPERARSIEASPRFGKLARDIKLSERTDRVLHSLPERLRGGTPAEALRAAATRTVAFLATGVLTIFFLQHGPRIARGARDQIRDPARRANAERLAVAVYRRAFGYAGAALAMSLAAGLTGFLAARLADVPGPAALGVWVGLWDLVPLAGAFVGAVPIVLLTAASSGQQALKLVMVFIAYQAVENLLVERNVERSTVRVGPFVTVAAGLIGLELSGVAGALLTVLAATIAMTAADELAKSEPAVEDESPAEEDSPAEEEPAPAEDPAPLEQPAPAERSP